MKRVSAAIAAVIMMFVLAAPAVAGNHDRPPVKHRHHHHKPKPPEPTPTPVPVPPQENRAGYCVVTVEYGWTYFDLNVGQADRGSAFRALYDNSRQVVTDGKTVTLAGANGDAGIRLAPVVPGLGGTCDPPNFP